MLLLNSLDVLDVFPMEFERAREDLWAPLVMAFVDRAAILLVDFEARLAFETNNFDEVWAILTGIVVTFLTPETIAFEDLTADILREDSLLASLFQD